MRYIVLLLVVVLLGCSKESCECEREVYELVDSKVFNAEGEIVIHTKRVLLYKEAVVCQDEVREYTEFHSDLVFKISCN